MNDTDEAPSANNRKAPEDNESHSEDSVKLSWVSLPGVKQMKDGMKMANRLWIKVRPIFQMSIPSIKSASQVIAPRRKAEANVTAPRATAGTAGVAGAAPEGPSLVESFFLR